MIKEHLHQQIIKHLDQIMDWFQKKTKPLSFPFYSSYDIRDSFEKISPVDANLFPAGFNNICDIDKENATTTCAGYLKKYYSQIPKTIILLAEEHTNNPFYWDNIYSLKHLLEQSGVSSVLVCVPGKNIKEDVTFTSANGKTIEVFLLKNKAHNADLIISNNDFSVDYNLDINQPITPPPTAGWRIRRKHSFFDKYNELAQEFSTLIEVPDFILDIKTQRFTNFNPSDADCLNRLKEDINVFLKELEEPYKNFKQKPYVFLKNNFGTYGLGITTINSAQDIDQWNYSIRKKMKASKGGAKVTELILQEGISSLMKKEGAVAEPVIYLIGSALAGGFLRTHKQKGIKDNLNSPGAVYRTLCVSDLKIEVEGKPMENVYGWIAYIGAIALAYEFQSMNSTTN